MKKEILIKFFVKGRPTSNSKELIDTIFKGHFFFLLDPDSCPFHYDTILIFRIHREFRINNKMQSPLDLVPEKLSPETLRSHVRSRSAISLNLQGILSNPRVHQCPRSATKWLKTRSGSSGI